jgi:Zn finger protein HypA/HybF involved in hydrogenase expression
VIEVEKNVRRSPLEVFKCNQCSRVFPTHGHDRLTCPNCGRLCMRGEDEILRVTMAVPVESRQAA